MSTKTTPRKNKKSVKKPKKSMFGVLKKIHKEFKREKLDRFG